MASKVPDIPSLIELWRWELDKLHKLASNTETRCAKAANGRSDKQAADPCWCWNEFKSVATEQNKPESLPKERRPSG